MQVLILHGWGNNSKSNWFPWLKQQLEARGAEVHCPDLPDSAFPNLDSWLGKIKEAVLLENDFVIIGHSLGAVTALRLLETFDSGKKALLVVLVSGFAKSYGVNALSSFFKSEFNWKKIKSCSKRFIVIHSDNDPQLPLAEGRELASMLGAEFIIEKNAGHINSKSGFTEYGRVLGFALEVA